MLINWKKYYNIQTNQIIHFTFLYIILRELQNRNPFLGKYLEMTIKLAIIFIRVHLISFRGQGVSVKNIIVTFI